VPCSIAANPWESKAACVPWAIPKEGDQAADLAVKNPYWNPRPVEHEAISSNKVHVDKSKRKNMQMQNF